MSAVAWKPVQSGRHTASPRSEPTSAVQRAGSGLASLPTTRTAMPKAIGTQITSERTYPWNIGSCSFPVRSELLQVEPEERKQREHAEDHRERIVVDVARLHAPGHAGEKPDRPGGPVHHDPVDDGLVAPRPQARAHAARAAGEEPVVEV